MRVGLSAEEQAGGPPPLWPAPPLPAAAAAAAAAAQVLTVAHFSFRGRRWMSSSRDRGLKTRASQVPTAESGRMHLPKKAAVPKLLTTGMPFMSSIATCAWQLSILEGWMQGQVAEQMDAQAHRIHGWPSPDTGATTLAGLSLRESTARVHQALAAGWPAEPQPTPH